MRIGVTKVLIALTVATTVSLPAFSESLFRTGVSYDAYPIQPKALYSTVRARSIGDLITVQVRQSISSSDMLQLDIEKDSSTTDNFSTLLNKILPGKPIPNELDSFGGTNSVGNSAKLNRAITFNDTITAQVVQVLPNGNLVIQGKKTSINSGEKVEIVLSGIVDPRFIDNMGRVSSTQVANLQLAVLGNGVISRSNSEGTINKFIRYMF